MSWIVYTDGGAAPSNPGPAAWGAVVITPDKVISHHKGFIGQGTNQIAELTAAIEGLSLIPADSKVELVSDSQYVLKGLTEWRSGWERNGMRNSKKEVVANLELWKRLYQVADARKVTTRWIKGHSGDKYNEQADVLVGEALAIARSKAA
ncbi:ribonuclease H [Glaciimonas sp. PAMC28666]|uniref:ribonuclease H family protein n=1 Tax=Glaciimonas sp. PAMC28666 TaxID=2807626 RepID=UPI001963C0B0|nr:ribonuclease H [Glaciimonas sp. PAMC28666]QRX81716.1 ribonuclease HI [Glaciimonas sp. PAMC28666]